MKLLWLTDLHLDRATAEARARFYLRLKEEVYDAAVITGDISCGRRIDGNLADIARATSLRPVYFLLGNHDFYGSSFDDVQKRVEQVCAQHGNLRQLGHGEIIALGNEDALIGHQGWADGRAGWGSHSLARNPDFYAIRDFCGLSQDEAFARLNELGRDCAQYFRSLLPYALTCHRRVWIATHVPPFSQAAHFDGKPCDRLRQPFYSNISAGRVIRGIAGRFPDRRLKILCGHTHCRAAVRAASNIDVLVGAARTGAPDFQMTFSLN
jgi:3',5'-cyclic-AMP phosphodiesterase